MNALAVYVHIPFCTVKCGYCDFNAYAGMDALKDRYAQAVLAEIEGWRDDLAKHAVTSIAFGGGTPGEQPASDIAAIIDAIGAIAPVMPGAEISLEANPGTVVEAYLADLREAGVTRLSIGAQSFVPSELQFLDRIHSVEAIGATVHAARSAGFQSVNLDLIYGLQDQSLAGWLENVDQAIDLGVDHLSLYALTVEPDTPLASRVVAGSVILPEDDELAEMYEAAGERLESAGFEQYEVSNWARPGHQSRHNRNYWEYGEYLGLGAGAHGFFEEERYENIAHPRAYVEAASSGPRAAIQTSYRPDIQTAIVDWLSLRLRLVEGFSVVDFKRQFTMDIDAVLGEPMAGAIQAGALDYKGGVLSLSKRGRLLHGEIVARSLAYLQAHPEAIAGVTMAARC